MENQIDFRDVNIRILWCAAWNQAATIFSGLQLNNKVETGDIEKLARELFTGMLKPYMPSIPVSVPQKPIPVAREKVPQWTKGGKKVDESRMVYEPTAEELETINKQK